MGGERQRRGVKEMRRKRMGGGGGGGERGKVTGVSSELRGVLFSPKDNDRAELLMSR